MNWINSLNKELGELGLLSTPVGTLSADDKEDGDVKVKLAAPLPLLTPTGTEPEGYVLMRGYSKNRKHLEWREKTKLFH